MRNTPQATIMRSVFNSSMTASSTRSFPAKPRVSSQKNLKTSHSAQLRKQLVQQNQISQTCSCAQTYHIRLYHFVFAL